MAAHAIEFNPFQVILEKLDSIQNEISALKLAQSQPETKDRFLSSKEVCDILRISPPTRIALAKSGRLIPMRVGRKLLYSKKAVDEALKQYSKWDRI